jgi:catechol 2,3-dioxygenase
MTQTGELGQGPRDPEELEAAAATILPSIAPTAFMGPVHLSVSDLKRSVDYYTQAIGLASLESGSGRAILGTLDRELLVLSEERGARPASGYAGLYHFALLVERRVDLARWIAHAARDRVQLTGASDHFVSEALYLSDPDEHGIEIYWDRPREVWEGQVASRLTTLPLDIEGILDELDRADPGPFAGLPTSTVMGHVHFRVSAIPGTVTFYRDLLGFGLMAQLGSMAAFLSAGGYHHHVGANTWESAGADQAPEGTARLLHATIVVPDGAERERVLSRLEKGGYPPTAGGDGPMVRDPSGNAILIAVA